MTYTGIKWLYVVKWYDKGARSFETYDKSKFDGKRDELEKKQIKDYACEVLKKYV